MTYGCVIITYQLVTLINQGRGNVRFHINNYEIVKERQKEQEQEQASQQTRK